MTQAHDYFERLRRRVLDVAAMVARANEMREACLPGTPTYGSVGGRSAPGAVTRVDRLVDYEAEVDRELAALAAEVSRACDVIYGRDGCGGIVKLRSPLDADIVYARYVEAQSWNDIANALAPAGSSAPEDWCRMRAARSLAAVDEVGLGRVPRMPRI